MSGHSKFKSIKHKKEAADQKRSAAFGKFLKAVTIAAKSEPNPDFNPALRSAIDQAKKNNVPLDTIQRALKKIIGVWPLLQLESWRIPGIFN